MSVNMKETPDKIKKGKLEFQVIYSRKIEGSVAAVTGVIFGSRPSSYFPILVRFLYFINRGGYISKGYF